jgi:zinc/manganese transport system permease protein
MQIFATLFPPGIFTSPFMQDAWLAGTAVAVLSACVGFFVVLRGASFAAHAVPRASFAGAAGAALVGGDTLLGLAVFSALSALGIASLTARRDQGQITAMVLMAALGLGSLFLALGQSYAPEVYALLFGQIVGISRADVFGILALLLLALAATGLLFRPLLWSSVAPDVAEAKGVPRRRMDILFLLLVALSATAAVPVVGALLSFSLMVAPAAAAGYFSRSPAQALGIAVLIGVLSVWFSLVFAYDTGLPVGFFVAAVSAVFYGLGRLWAHLQELDRRAAEAA